MRYSFGEDWWGLKKKDLLDTREDRKLMEINKLRTYKSQCTKFEHVQ